MTAGAVLCGGSSRRMGTDKALVEVDGVPMAQRVADALAEAGCEPVVLVGGDTALLARFGRPVVPDEWPGHGPLGGVLSALRALGQDVVVAACDLAHLDAAAVRVVMAAARADRSVAVAVARTDRLEPALAWWSAGALDPLTEAWSDGVRALHEAVERLASVEVDVDRAAMRNVNTVEDLAAADPADG